ncbi:MAG: kinase [Verrucomicrobiales bacterium]
MKETIESIFGSFMREERLPPVFLEKLCDHYVPLAEQVAEWRRGKPAGPLLLGVNGAQGTGKSTLAGALALALEEMHGMSVAVVSIDDLYLTKSDREELAARVHPLLVTRGVPGTHDVALGCSVLDALSSGEPCAVPRFEKARDDRAARSDWTEVSEPVDVIIFEGWCVGARAQDESELAEPVNALERDEDADGVWRRYVNDALAGPYVGLFGRFDRLVMLCPPGFECIRDWRGEQEEKLRQKFLTKGEPLPEGVMDEAGLLRFISHYERMTRWMLEEMPGRADVVFMMNRERDIVESRA